MRRSICELTKPSARRELRLAGISTSTTADVHIRVLTAAPRIKPTSTRCHSAWQPKPGRGSTYRRGDFVQTSGTSSEGVHTFKLGVNYYFNTLARIYPKAPPMAAVYDDWRGFYVGPNGGFGSSRECFELPRPSRDKCIAATGGLAGGQIGYRWQSSWWVFGLEAQGDWASLSGSAVSKLFPGNSDRARVDGICWFTGHVGYAWNRALVFVRGGAAVTADRYNTFVTATNFLNGAASET